jgi:hypothetical protein
MSKKGDGGNDRPRQEAGGQGTGRGLVIVMVEAEKVLN